MAWRDVLRTSQQDARFARVGRVGHGGGTRMHRTMPRLTRRSFLAGTAAVVGAGAAGIAAARRIVAAGRRVAVIEAADRVGGRCVTDTRTFGVPYDRGAHWLHMHDINPVAKLAAGAKLDVYPAPPG